MPAKQPMHRSPIMQNQYGNNIDRMKQTVNNMFTESQKQEIFQALAKKDQERLRQLVTNMKLDEINEAQLAGILKNINKDELIRKIKGV